MPEAWEIEDNRMSVITGGGKDDHCLVGNSWKMDASAAVLPSATKTDRRKQRKK